MTKVYFYVSTEREIQVINTLDPNSFLGIHDYFTGEIATTYFYLKKAGLDCEVTNRIPEAGIVFGDRDSFNKILLERRKYLGRIYKYPGNAMLLVLKSDREFYPPAHINIVHNPIDFKKNRRSIWNPYYDEVLFWPQPGLISRLKERDRLVENVAYIGSKSQLAKELKSDRWRSALSSLGCNWLLIDNPKQWGDYRQIDLIVAARSFDKNPYLNKPANKLINCWRAGVPAIMAPESSILAQTKTELDCLLVNSLEEAILAVQKLKNDPDLYAKMVSNGLDRAQHFTTDKAIEKWLIFFDKFVFPAYEKWSKLTESQKKTLFLRRALQLKIDGLTTRIKNFTSLIFYLNY